MISEMRHHHQVLREFARELAMQESQFYNTCVNLLEDMVSPEEQTLLMQDPGGELWSTPDFTEKLHERMRQHSAMQFMRAIETMKEVLVELNEKFLIDTTRVYSVCRASSNFKLIAL